MDFPTHEQHHQPQRFVEAPPLHDARVRHCEVRDDAMGRPAAGVSRHDESLPGLERAHKGFIRILDGGRRAVWYLGLLVGISLATPAYSAPTYTGGPFNFCLPTSDDYDWADCVNYDFQVMNSSWTDLGNSVLQVGVDTETLRTDLTAEAAARAAADAGKVDKNSPDQVNLSTVTDALALKADLFTGISSSCAAGYFMSSGTWRSEEH